MPDNRRLLELALKGLYSERERIDGEIREISERLDGGAPKRNALRTQPAEKTKPRAHGRSYSAAQKKVISERMRKYWADRRKSAKQGK